MNRLKEAFRRRWLIARERKPMQAVNRWLKKAPSPRAAYRRARAAWEVADARVKANRGKDRRKAQAWRTRRQKIAEWRKAWREAVAKEKAAQQPTRRIVTRAEWGARPPRARYTMTSDHNGVFIHHTVGATPTNLEAGKVEMRNIQRFHMDTRGWLDIAYSYLVDLAGNVYEGRGKGVVGGHTENHNSTSHAICFMGNYENTQPSAAQIAAARWVRRDVLGAGSKPLRPHSAVASTACPGSNVRAILGQL